MSLKAEKHLGKQMDSIYEFQGRIFFPYYYWRDYFEESEIGELEYQREKNNLISLDSKDVSIDKLYEIRKECYSAQVWYSHLSKYTFPSKLIKWDGSNEDLKKILGQEKSWPLFVKLDSMSPKDVHSTCVFDNPEQVVKAFTESNRIQNCKKRIEYPLCLFIRQVNADCMLSSRVELRCFIHRSKLTAFGAYYPFFPKRYIFTEDEKQNIIQYLQKNIIPKLPYSDATVDLIQNNEGQLMLIEVNNFGIDSIAGADPFDWDQDYAYLYGFLGEEYIYTHFN